MAMTFCEPGGDATFTAALWASGTATAVNDFTYGGHQKSLKYTSTNFVSSPTGVVSDTGGRFTGRFFIAALPSSTNGFILITNSAFTLVVAQLKMTSAGVLQLFEATTQIGSDGPTLAINTWYRIAIEQTITSKTINRFEVQVFDYTGTNQLGSISVTNATLTNNVSSGVQITTNGNGTFNIRSCDHYIDGSSSLTDPGNIMATAKRPVSNGTTNDFSTQVGSGGSNYGTGHALQENERPLSTTNGWSMVGAGAAVTEEYTIEGQAVGDMDVSIGTIVDYMGWVNAKSALAETGQIIVAGATSNISLTNSNVVFRAVAGSATYPSGGTDIGIVTSTTLTTVTLNECGIVVAFIPSVTPPLLLQQSTNSKGSSGTTLALTITPVAGNTIICTYGSGGTAKVSSISTNGTGTWVKAIANATNGAEIWYLQNTDGSDTSFTLTQSVAGAAGATISEWNDLLMVGTLIEGTNTGSATSTTADTGTITPTTGTQRVIIGVAGISAGGVSTPPSNGFFPLATNASQENSAYAIVPNTSGSYSTQWTLPSSHSWLTAIAGFIVTPNVTGSVMTPKFLSLLGAGT